MTFHHQLLAGLLCLIATRTASGCAFHALPEMRLEGIRNA